MKNVIVIMLVALIAVLVACSNEADNKGGYDNTGDDVIGGDTDQGGCLIGAGYQYDEEIGACIRVWEIDEAMRPGAKIAVDFVGQSEGLAVIMVSVQRCPDCYYVELQKPDENPIGIQITDSVPEYVEDAVLDE